MQITWVHCASYEEAKDFCRCIYLHEWNHKPFYWGKAHNSFFGGHKRTRNGLTASGRYNAGYRHWIEGCLRHGGKLYIGLLEEYSVSKIDEIENWLIYTYGHVMNTKVRTPPSPLGINHKGNIPTCIANHKIAK